MTGDVTGRIEAVIAARIAARIETGVEPIPSERRQRGMRRRAAAFRRARAAHRVVTIGVAAIGLLVIGAACAGDAPAPPDEVASESPTVPTPEPSGPATTPTTVTPAPTARPTTAAPTSTPATVATTRAGDRSAVRLALQAARDRWRAAGVQTYEHRYSLRCDCEPLAATVRVLGGRVLGAVTGQGLELATVVEWFDEVGRAIDDADTVEVDFDDDLGHPLHVLIDPDTATAGDEYGLDTAGFRVVDDPVRRWFTESWACDDQLAAATPDQSAVLVIEIGTARIDPEGPTAVATLPRTELRFGSAVMAGWCDDEQGAGPATIDATWALTGGTLDLEVGGRSVTGEARALVASTPTGAAVELGSVELRNDARKSAAG